MSAVNGQDHSSSHRSSTSSNESGDGDAVVVKVLHPGVRDQVSADMDLLGASAWAVEQLPLLGLQYLSLRQLVGEFDKVSVMRTIAMLTSYDDLGLLWCCFTSCARS